ncbi:MAG: hypothetical protein WCV63_02675 [Negativicutes bacterium]|jgi:cyclopropane fatty-acyl-phospholipid synthase-like methyltransferase
MNNDRIKKFENPERVAELNPQLTLRAAGFERGMTLCDIGAGTGLFTFAAADCDLPAVSRTIFASQL